jgi:hypothetical protein
MCFGTQVVCNNACVDTNVDLNNCGTCGHVCTTVTNGMATCTAGMCGIQCNSGFPFSYTLCGIACVDLTSDSMNCGMCGNACPAGETCINSQCGCANSLTYCPSTMMCVDTHSDAQNCGMCGHACGAGQQCTQYANGFYDCCINLMGTCNPAGGPACCNGFACSSGVCCMSGQGGCENFMTNPCCPGTFCQFNSDHTQFGCF